jgi:predicted nucleic acid-binding protein
MKARVYIETSIPSYYCEIREDTESSAKKLLTREWWDHHRRNYELVTAPPVIDELERGEYPTKSDALELIRDIPILELTKEAEYIVEEYIRHHLMPKDPKGDALHLALASFYNCRFLLTWNCQHLANANKFEHIRHVNTLLGLFVPILTTPYSLMCEYNEDEK